MTTVTIRELPRRGQVYRLPVGDEEVEVTSVTFDSEGEDALITLRRLHESRTEPVMLRSFLDQQPELVLH